jgi:hypothetical protein
MTTTFVFEDCLKLAATVKPATFYRNSWIDVAPTSARIRREGANMIKKVKGGYKVLSEKGKNLGGPYRSKEEAAKRLRQVEFFKHQKG